MRMDLDECIRFANENPVTYVATMDGDQPRVRAFRMWFADRTGFYYHTGRPKDVCRQLEKNPRLELCFFSPSQPPAGRMMRVTGKVEFLDDLVLRTRLLEERPFLKAIVTNGPSDPILAVFRVPHGESYFWTMELNMREHEAPRVKF